MKAQIQDSLFLISEVEVSYRPKFKASERPKVSCSKQAFDILYNNWNQHTIEMTEQCCILLLNRANNVLGIKEISSGGMDGTVVDLRLIFSVALKTFCAGIILCHNHPSGNLKPSEADIALTRRIVEAGKLLDVKVLDHLIITKDAYYSFGDDGMI